MTTAPVLRALRACVDGPDCGETIALGAARLTNANISPVTGLATDYLNHFNEAIMLLDLAATVPECLADLMAWRPTDYEDHFASSSFRDHELAVRAEIANPSGELKPLMFATVGIHTAADRTSLAVPQSAVIYEGEQARVWLAHNDRSLGLRVIRVDRFAQRVAAKTTEQWPTGPRVSTYGSPDHGI